MLNKKIKKKVKKVIKPKRVVNKKIKPSKEEYAKLLQHPKWQKKRLKIMERDKWMCRKCKNTESTLHVHHLRYTSYYPWQEKDVNLVTYCNSCHFKTHKN
jgi:hypothetical protein